MQGNLQPRPTSFVDRREDLRVLRGALAGGARLVTVSGPPGVGKSRLAIEVSLALAGDYKEGGVWLCDLNGASDVPALCARVAGMLEPKGGAARGDEVARLGLVIAQRPPLLLLFDGFDQLVEAGASVLTAWLAAAPQARFMVTSRERLRIGEETLVELEPLPASAAIELFDARAVAIRREWSTAENRELISGIVKSLDCLPLAVELAAARMDLMGPADLLAALDDRVDVLATAARDSNAHHVTLAAAIHASWLGLSAPERAALEQASVFSASFSLAAATAVLEVDGQLPLLEVLHSLRRKSLLVSSAGAAPGRARFRLYETVRQYARARLAEGDHAAAARARHARYYAQPDGDWIEEDLSDMVAVVDASLGVEPALALQVLLAAEPLLWRSGRADQVEELLSRALATPEAPELDDYTRALELRGRARRLGGDTVGAARDLNEALARSTDAGDELGRGRTLFELATLELIKGRFAASRTRFETSIEAYRAAGDRLGEGDALDGIAAAVYHLGQGNDEARGFLLEALRIFRDIGARDKEAIVRGHLGVLALERGMHHEARSQIEAALAIHRERGDLRFEAGELASLGLVALDQSDVVAAAVQLEAALALHRRTGDARGIGLTLLDVGICREEQDDLSGAALAYGEAVEIGRLTDDYRTMAFALSYRGRVAAREGNSRAARSVFAEAEELLAANPNPEAEAILALCRAHLEDALPLLPDGLGDSLSVRVALRMAADGRVHTSARLRLDRGARTFALGTSAPVSLLARPTLWRVLACLVEQRVAQPGGPVDRETLFEVGWPDEHISSASAAGRVRSAVYGLRKLGLSDVLASSNEGYTLSPDVDIELQ